MYRYLLILLLSAISPFLSSQTKLSLDEAIRASIRHKPSLEILRLQEKQENLSLQEIKARWWPEISLSYNYRYNPVVATSILPIGQFDINNPTNEVRGIKMGTKWQQNGGLSISQPLIDFSIIRAVRQSKNLCKLAITNQKIGRDELIYETARCYLTICQKEKILENSIQDTLRTFTTLRLQEALFRHERLLVSDLNRARINHNESVNLLENTRTDLLTEKIFLSFLTGFTPDSLILFTRFDYDPAISLAEKYSEKRGRPDSLYSIQNLQLEQETARLELQTVKANSLPTLSLEAFLGANQYNQHFSPFEKHTWYGSSYVGVSFKLPILFKENFTARNKRLQLNIRILSLQEEEERSRLSTEALQSYYRIQAIRQEINRIKENKALEQQSLLILSRRFKEQQTTAFELNLEELEYLKMQTVLSQKYTEEVIETLNYLQNSGLLYLLLQEPE